MSSPPFSPHFSPPFSPHPKKKSVQCCRIALHTEPSASYCPKTLPGKVVRVERSSCNTFRTWTTPVVHSRSTVPLTSCPTLHVVLPVTMVSLVRNIEARSILNPSNYMSRKKYYLHCFSSFNRSLPKKTNYFLRLEKFSPMFFGRSRFD